MLARPKHYDRHQDVPESEWRWRNFSPAEIACKGTGSIIVHPQALDALQRLRDALGHPINLVSAYRSPEHNRRVGGAARSKHMEGIAFDVSMSNQDPAEFIRTARSAGFQGIGTYPRSMGGVGFVHVDLGPARTWGDPFPPRETRFAAEPARVRENLSGSRTMQGSGVAGAATVGAGAIEAVQTTIVEAQDTVSSLASSLEVVKWVMLGLALLGIVVTIYARMDDWKKGRR